MLRVKLSVVLILLTLFHTGVFSQPQNADKFSEMESLRKQLETLKTKLNALTTEFTDSDSGAASLEIELAAELGLKLPTAGMSQETLASRRNLFQNMNPNVSVIGSALGSASSRENLKRNVDLIFQEGEFSFQAAVDPYAKADFFIAFGRHQENDLIPQTSLEDGGGEIPHSEEEGGLQAELEEAYITFLSLPFSTQLKIGKFRSKFGKINETHPHAHNFIDLPLMYSNFFGSEGLGDEGASLNWLLPNKAFFQEFTFQITSGPDENASFVRAENNKLLYLVHLKNFFDLNDNTTLELGINGLSGPHNAAGETTKMLAADLTFRWKPLQRNRRKSFELMSEAVVSRREGAAEDITSFGFFGFARYQLAQRWFLGALFDYAEFPQFKTDNRMAFSGILQLFATEFQKVEFQCRHNRGSFFDSFNEFKVRAVFVIGAHGAHKY